MAKHVCVAVLFCILAYVESTPYYQFGPPSHHGPPPYYGMAPAPCGYAVMMPPPCPRFPFSCPPQNRPSPCQSRNGNGFGLQLDPAFRMSINWGDSSPQDNPPNNMKRHIGRRRCNPKYRRCRKNKGRWRKKIRGSRRQPYGGHPIPWQANRGSYGRPNGSGWGKRLHDEGGFIANDNSDTNDDESGESPYPYSHNRPEDGNFGDDDGDDDEDANDYDGDDDDGGYDNGVRHDEGEGYDDDQAYDDDQGYDDDEGHDDGRRYDEGDNYDDADDDDDY